MLGGSITRGRSGGIDCLRAIFALWVLLAHLIPWARLAQGDEGAAPFLIESVFSLLGRFFQSGSDMHPAVLGFIVLSGYCIHRAGFRIGRVDVAPYAIRRAFRILPVYIIGVLAGVVAFNLATAASPDMGRMLSGTKEISPACVAGRVLALGAFDPFHYRCMFLGNAPLNTVMVEIWLYVAYPVLFVGVGLRYGETAIWRVLIGIWALGVAGLTIFPSAEHWWNHASLLGFLLIWWIGAKATDPEFQRVIEEAVIPLCVLYVLLTVPFLIKLSPSPICTQAREVILALLCAHLIVRMDKVNAPLLAPLSYLGKAGYSLYAFHAPVAYTMLIYGYPLWSIILAAMVAGIAGYYIVEAPFMWAGSRLARGRRAQTQPAI